MKIIFRADGNSTTGLGHLYRIFALIEIYKKKFEFILITKQDSTLSVIPQAYNYQCIPASVTGAQEAKWLRANYSSSAYMIIADGYQFDGVYQKQIKNLGYDLMYIDDQMKEKMHADIVVNHALSVKVSDYTAEPYTKFALGTNYAILRPSFLKAAAGKRKVETPSIAFVCFGGADPTDLTAKATQALLDTLTFKKINVVIGAAYPHQTIFDLAKKYSQLHVIQNADESKLLSIMKECNFAIAPASTISYELCTVKMPILCGYYVENQKHIHKGSVEAGCVIDAGNFENYTVADFKQKVLDALKQNDLQKYVDAQEKLFDANITQRFLDLIPAVNYRKAEEKDMMLLFEWNNDPIVRANSYSTEPIVLETHQKWFEKKIKDNNALLYIAEVDGQPAGLVRYDKARDHSIVGVIVSSTHRGKGLAAIFLKDTSVLYFKDNELPVQAFIKKNNLASIASFEKALYKKYKEEMISGTESFVYVLKKPEASK